MKIKVVHLATFIFQPSATLILGKPNFSNKRSIWPKNTKKATVWFVVVYWCTTFLSHHMYRYESMVLLREGNLEYVYVQYHSKVSYQLSHFSWDKSLWDEHLITRDEHLVSKDKSLVSWDSLKRQFWNMLWERLNISTTKKQNDNETLFPKRAVMIKLET